MARAKVPCGCLTAEGRPREEFPRRYQAVGSIAIKKPVDGWQWVIDSCPKKKTVYHIRPEKIVVLEDWEKVTLELSIYEVDQITRALIYLHNIEPSSVELRDRLKEATDVSVQKGKTPILPTQP